MADYTLTISDERRRPIETIEVSAEEVENQFGRDALGQRIAEVIDREERNTEES